MKRGASAVIYALALMWVPVATATDSLLELRVSELRSDGDVNVEAEFSGLLIEKDVSVPAIQIAGGSLHLETDTTEPGVHTDTIEPGGANGVTSKSTPADYESPTLRLVAARDGHRINLYGKGASLSSSLACAKVESSDVGSVKREPWAYRRPAVVVDLNQALRLESCGSESAITVRGDVLLSVWEADLELVVDGKTTMLESGRLQTKYVPGGVDSRPYVSRDQELYLLLHDAVITISYLPAPIYTQDPKISAHGLVKLGAAEGSIDLATESTALHNAALNLRGNLEISAQGVGASKPFAIRAQGDVQAASIDGAALAIAPATASFPWWYIWLGGLMAVLALGLYERPIRWYKQHLEQGRRGPHDLPVGHRQKRAVGYWSHGTLAFNELRMRKAKRMATKAIRLFPESIDTQALHALLILRTGNPARALPYFIQLHPKMPGGAERSAAACAAAEAALLCNQPTDALNWLRTAHRDHFSTFLAAIDRPEFDDLEGNEWFATMRAVARHEPPPGPRREAEFI